MKPVIASDGYAARPIREWSREKHHYIDRYLNAFCTSMKDKWNLVYADLFSGPGLCVDVTSHSETSGSPLLALQHSELKKLFFNDLSPEATAALQARTASGPAGRVLISNRSANDCINAARAFLFPGGRQAGILPLVLVDPFGLQISLEALRQLTYGPRMDLIIIFMSDYIRRFGKQREMHATLTSFYGNDFWIPVVFRQDQPRVTYRQLLNLYQESLNSIGYFYFDDRITIRNSIGHTIYHIVFASKHRLGTHLFRAVSGKDDAGQLQLGL